MRKTLILFGIIVFVVVVVSFVLQFLRNSKQKQFMYLLQNNEFETLYKKIDSVYTKSIFPEYNREYIRLNALIMQDRKEEIDATFDKLIPMAKDKSAKIDILDKAFEYYVYDENQEKCDQIIKEIEKLDDEKMLKFAKMLYDIMILKKSNHIKEIEKDFDKQPAMQRAANAYLLSVQYKNKGNEETAQYYENVSKSLVEGEKG